MNAKKKSSERKGSWMSEQQMQISLKSGNYLAKMEIVLFYGNFYNISYVGWRFVC